MVIFFVWGIDYSMFRIFKIYSFLISFTLIFNCNADIKEEINSNVVKSQSDFIEVYRPELNYLPSNDKLKKTTIVSNVEKQSQKVSFNLPDAFYFIGAPIFLFILLRLVATFIGLFEDERRKDLKKQSNNK